LIKNNEALDKALDKALTKHASKHEQSTYQSTDSINKQYNKETIEQENDETLKEKFDLYKNHLLSESVIERLCINAPVKITKDQSVMVMNEFIETCYGDIVEKGTKLQAEQYFINWVKKENKVTEAITAQLRKQKIKVTV
jgi:hypothetical protein